MNSPKPVTISMPAKPLNVGHLQTLNALLDVLIPASSDGAMPAASGLGLFDDLRAMPDATRARVETGLNWLQSQSATEHGKPFSEITAEQASALFQTLRAENPGCAGALTLQITARYLQSDPVVIALGLEARPHWPNGYQVPQSDWGLLEPVRKRGEIWRKT